MRSVTIGLVDYDVGNLTSVRQAIEALNYKCKTSDNPSVLEAADCLILPGVGAFPHAMGSLVAKGLDEFIRVQAKKGKPVLGICLGMQLLADSSVEITPTQGLGLIPGNVVSLPDAQWHIGWNSIEATSQDSFLQSVDGASVYFNHSFIFDAEPKYQVGVTSVGQGDVKFPIAVQRDNVVGLQFHPEKSQKVGRHLLANLIESLRCA